MDPKRPLSEISHLFLSDIRARTPGGQRPSRVPPPKSEDVSVDMTPEEFEVSLSAAPTDMDGELPPAEPEAALNSKPKCISVVISGHLAELSSPSVRQYARQLATETGPIGLIEAENTEFSVTCFEKGDVPPVSPLPIDLQDARKINDTLNELAYDVNRWLICMPGARTPETRELLRSAPHWIMLTTADHEGVVSTYRALKGLAELGTRRISLVVLDARDEAHADAVFRKLDAVSRQFLHCGFEDGSMLRSVEGITEHSLLQCRGDQPIDMPAKHWKIVRELMAGATGPTLEPKNEQAPTMKLNIPENPKMPPIDKFPMDKVMMDHTMPEVIDLPGDASDRSILDAVVRQGGADGRWVTCPLHPPMCPEAIVAVGRDQRLMLLAVAGRGMGQLLSIGQAHKWMSENSELIRMALPQLAIDPSSMPAITLFVDHNDLSAEVLQPMLQSGTVTVQAYRKVKWGAKTGLLLEAA